MIKRSEHMKSVLRRLATNRVVAVLGPRQCGKTTLARLVPHTAFYDLENPRDLGILEDPLYPLESARGTVVIDEIQRRPDLFPVIRHLVDRPRSRSRFLILGSASRDLIRQSSETLAGRISYYELPGFTLDETGLSSADRLWLRGGLPRSFLSKSEENSFQWRDDYVTSFLERDIPQLGIRIPSNTLRRFWTMLGHYHGQVIQFSEIARSFGISDMTVRHYLEILEGTFAVRVVQPWHQNTGKRLVKHPKIYIADTGIFHYLMGIRNRRELETHPKLGASWEGFVYGQLKASLQCRSIPIYFWRTHAGAELDLYWKDGGRNYGLEVKRTQTPRLTPSMRSAIKDLKLDRLFIVHPGSSSYELSAKVEVIPVARIGAVTCLRRP